MWRVCTSVVLLLLASCGERASAPPAEQPEPPPETPAVPPEEPEELPPVAERTPMLALGGAHGCQLTAGGEVRCWGGNQFGQLGDPAAPTGWSSSRHEPRAVAGLDEPVRIAAGTFHTCALLADGEVRCWGHGGFGQLGDGGTADRPSPVAVSGLPRAVEVVAAEGHGCARLQEGSVSCWGRNLHGQLGDGTREHRSTVVSVALSDVVQLCAGRDHSCARRSDGSVHCWGAAFEGQLGDGSNHRPEGSRPTPSAVSELTAATTIACGSAHVCARIESGALRCWGANDAGQLGVQTRRPVVSAPAEVVGVDDAVEIGAGGSHTCARTAAGTVTCWGANAFGQLGDTTRDPRRQPVSVAGLSGADHLAVGIRFNCVQGSGSDIRCWGGNFKGQLGDGTRTMRPQLTTVGVLSEDLEETPAAVFRRD